MLVCSLSPSPRPVAWLVLCAGAAAVFVAQSLRAQTVVAPLASPVATAGAEGSPAAPAKTPAWYRGGTLRLLAGHTDNVQLSPLESRGRGFMQGEVEAYAIHPARERWELRAIVSGELRRYVDPLPETKGEQRWLGRAEAAFAPARWLRLAAAGDAFYQDQVYDLSPDAGRRFVARMRVRGAIGTFQPRLTLGRRWEIEPMVQLRETNYLDFAEDFSETRGGVRVRWKRDERFQVSAAVHEHRREYRDRVNYTAGGRALNGTKLHFEQVAAEGRASWMWATKRGRWSVSPAVFYTTNRDEAAGFFDYDHGRARCDVAWEGGRWRVDADVGTGRYRYLVQTVGMGIAPPARVRDDSAVNVAVEYALTERWRVIARGGWERSRSNEINATYAVTTVSSGVACNF